MTITQIPTGNAAARRADQSRAFRRTSRLTTTIPFPSIAALGIATTAIRTGTSSSTSSHTTWSRFKQLTVNFDTTPAAGFTRVQNWDDSNSLPPRREPHGQPDLGRPLRRCSTTRTRSRPRTSARCCRTPTAKAHHFGIGWHHRTVDRRRHRVRAALQEARHRRALSSRGQQLQRDVSHRRKPHQPEPRLPVLGQTPKENPK